mgnify:CR=1 FL=1
MFKLAFTKYNEQFPLVSEELDATLPMTTGKVGATLIVVPPSIFSFIVTTSKVSCFTVPTLLCVTLTPFSFPIFIAKLESFASIMAMLSLFQDEQFSFKKFIKKLSMNRNKLYHCVNTLDYIDAIERLYNWGNATKVKFRRYHA